MAKIPKNKDENVDSVKMAAENFFKSNKDIIYNDPCEPYKVSTGVGSLDYLLGGGISSSSLCRLLGISSSGKSSMGLLIIKNFLESRLSAGKKARSAIFPTEARLTEKLQARTGVKFVHNPSEWESGTCLIIPTNYYEKIANFIWTLVKTNEMKKKEDRENFAFMVDCMDYLTLESDMEKEFGESRRPAGPQYLTKLLWSKLALPFQSGQHIFLAISQQSAAPKIDPYAKDPMRQGGSSGGSGIQYQATTVIEFTNRYEGDYILENPDAKYDPKKNIKIGHTVHYIIRKSDTEKYDVKGEYAVKYGRENGNSIWVELELSNQMVAWELLKRESAQGSFLVESNILEELRKVDAECPDKFRSQARFQEYLENKPEVTKFLVEKFKTMLS
jgi:hypothetical protein